MQAQAVRAVYDGSGFRLREPVPVTGNYEVVITFTKRINNIPDNRNSKVEAFENEKDALEFCNKLSMECVNETW